MYGLAETLRRRRPRVRAEQPRQDISVHQPAARSDQSHREGRQEGREHKRDIIFRLNPRFPYPIDFELNSSLLCLPSEKFTTPNLPTPFHSNATMRQE